jgi:hypothetical protein
MKSINGSASLILSRRSAGASWCLLWPKTGEILCILSHDELMRFGLSELNDETGTYNVTLAIKNERELAKS